MSAALAGGLAAVLKIVFNTLQVIIIASVLASMLGADPSNPIFRTIQAITEPLYRPFRPLARRIPGPLDWSPMIIILIIVFLDASLVRFLRNLATY